MNVRSICTVSVAAPQTMPMCTVLTEATPVDAASSSSPKLGCGGGLPSNFFATKFCCLALKFNSFLIIPC